MKQWLQFGYVARSHGLRGEVVIRTFDPASQALASAQRLLVRSKDGIEKEFEVESASDAPQGDVLVALIGIDDRNAADALKGSTVFADRNELPPPEPGEYFQGDLIGVTAVTPEGQVLGTVEGFWNSGPVPNLIIGTEPNELMVPFVEDFIVSVDLAGRRIVLNPPQFE